MRVILDVNVWISALLWDGIPDQLVLGEFQQIPILKSQDFLNRYFSLPPEIEK